MHLSQIFWKYRKILEKEVKLELNKTIKEFDPAKALATLIKNEKDLTNYMIEMGKQMCLKKTINNRKVFNRPAGCSIRPFNKEGPMVPQMVFCYHQTYPTHSKTEPLL